MKKANIFEGRLMAIATMHQKEKVIQPLLEKELGVKCIVPKNLDTDQFGTFTREISRTGNQLEAARKKAHEAIRLTGCDLALASEGSFGAHHSTPFATSNLELVLLYDAKNDLEILGAHRTPDTNMNEAWVKSAEEALTFAREWGFPDHGVIARRSKEGKRGIHKDAVTETDLEKKVRSVLRWPFISQVYLETDMRAHRNPTRMRAIEQATLNLIKNAQSACPHCQMPGFGPQKTEGGLPCRQCGEATSLPAYEVYQCAKCEHSKKEKILTYGQEADPVYCHFCNP